MTRILYDLKSRKDEDGEFLKGFFDGMGWPLPEENEFYTGQGGHDLVFMTQYGIDVRVTLDAHLLKDKHSHFILPLFNRQAGIYNIDIDPGYNHVTERQSRAAYKMYKRVYGLTRGDVKRQNLLSVPRTWPRYTVMTDLDPYQIKIDNSAVRPLTHGIERVKRRLRAAGLWPVENPQVQIYRPLREIMEEVWPVHMDAPDRVGVREFKRMLLSFKRAGRLVTPWVDPRSHYSDITDIAKDYAERLAATDRFQANPYLGY